MTGKIVVPVQGMEAFSELKMPCDAVVAADFDDLECGASVHPLHFVQRMNRNRYLGIPFVPDII